MTFLSVRPSPLSSALPRAVAVLLVLVLAAALAARHSEHIAFMEITSANILGVLTSLFVTALFIERAAEVLISVSRGPTADTLGDQLSSLDQRLAAATDVAEKTSLGAERETIAKQLLAFKATTKIIALWSNLCAGMVISAVGVRGLAGLLQTAPAGWQKDAFAAVDIILTGALIGGGAEGIHQLVSVITDFLDKTREGMKTGQ